MRLNSSADRDDWRHPYRLPLLYQVPDEVEQGIKQGSLPRSKSLDLTVVSPYSSRTAVFVMRAIH
jgi:hypothetical protein